MSKIIDAIIGNLGDKREYKKNETRAKALPTEYAAAYKDIRNYLFHTSGIVTIEPLKALVDMLEEAAANSKHVLDVTGPDVAAFADELVRGEKSYYDNQRKKLNTTLANKLRKGGKQ
jgi:DNA-binding ferritin-like protein (Dps family)